MHGDSKLYRFELLEASWLFFVTQGAFSEITGPVLPELIVQTHSGYQTIAQSLSMRGAGHALGGIIGENFISRHDRVCFCYCLLLV